MEFSKHVLEQMELRGISKQEILNATENFVSKNHEDGLLVLNTLILENGKQFLMRIFINEKVNPNLIVTVYKTSKIRKYYEGEI